MPKRQSLFEPVDRVGDVRQKIITTLWVAGTLICLVLTIKAALEIQWVLAIHWAVGFAIAASMAWKGATTTPSKAKTQKEKSAVKEE